MGAKSRKIIWHYLRKSKTQSQIDYEENSIPLWHQRLLKDNNKKLK